MDEDLLNGLRWVLMTAEEGWRIELHEVLERLELGREDLAEARQLLVGRMEGAAPQYRARMTAMIAEIDRRIGSERPDHTPAGRLAKRYADLDGQISALEAQLARLRADREAIEAELLAALGPGRSLELAGYHFEVREGGQDLAVVDPWALPSELCTPTPDMKSVRAAWQLEGRPPKGTRVVRAPARLEVWKVAL